MKNITILFCFLLVVAIDIPVLGQDTGVYVFTNVNVIPMDEERILTNQSVVVENGRITEVGAASSIEVPDGAMEIVSDGKYLMPGLAEMHGHIPPPNESDAYIKSVLFMYVANGVTTVRGMLGYDGQLELRAQAAANEIVSPNLYLAGPSFSGGSINSPAEAEAKVRRQKEEGWDLLKVHPGLTLAEYDAMANTANEVGIRFGGHVPADVGLAHALEMGQETFDHIDGYTIYVNGTREPASDEAIADVVKMTIDAGAWIVPTMVLWETLNGTAPMEYVSTMQELKYMPRNIVDSWVNTHRNRLSNPNLDLKAASNLIDNRNRILHALNEAGARILMGTDAPQQFSVPGFSIHRELERMVDAGMTPYEVYRTGTANVGAYFEGNDTFGLVAPGHRADLILVNENPLERVANIKQRAGVMVRGQWFTEDAIQSELNNIATRIAGQRE